MSGYANPEVLIETGWLEEHLDDTDLAIIEVDEDTDAYDKDHIPGAVAINWKTELRDLPRRDFLSREQLAELLGSKGVGGQTMVLYGGNNNWFATYAYWLFKLRGVDNVKLLNGGRKKWELESRAMTREIPNITAQKFTIGAERPEIRILRDDVIAQIGTTRGAMVDVRSPEEFRGELLAPPHLPQEQSQVPGHIPGASNIPWGKAADEDGTFKSVEELKKLYETEGVTVDKDVIAYCRIGERSSHTWFVLTELLGYPKVTNYDGSWTEYGSLVGASVEK